MLGATISFVASFVMVLVMSGAPIVLESTFSQNAQTRMVDMQLRPAAPLSSQMRQAESTSQTDSSTNMNSGNNQGVHGAALR